MQKQDGLPDLCKDSRGRAIIENSELEYQIPVRRRGNKFRTCRQARQLRRYHPFFELVNFRIIGEKP